MQPSFTFARANIYCKVTMMRNKRYVFLFFTSVRAKRTHVAPVVVVVYNMWVWNVWK